MRFSLGGSPAHTPAQAAADVAEQGHWHPEHIPAVLNECATPIRISPQSLRLLPLPLPLQLLLLLLLLPPPLTYRAPSAATELADKTPHGAAHMDVRRFSTIQGCIVEKSCQRSEPASRSGVGAEAGCVSFGYFFFAQAKKSDSLPAGE
ncbi:hypothetical protein [Stenotrophomonas sp. PS02298]|uniref:hypothetical protein n=1 Tax=Stenotrophomonas sp. PS02298 TaxID=2991424 RepID=UPI00249AA5EB|nr:hypothetical protein [Stenotrophomonas sp. PS02298]